MEEILDSNGQGRNKLVKFINQEMKGNPKNIIENFILPDYKDKVKISHVYAYITIFTSQDRIFFLRYRGTVPIRHHNIHMFVVRWFIY